MGSCSSGGPNKYTGMCLAKGGGAAAKDSDDLTRAADHGGLSTNLKRSSCPRDKETADESSINRQFASEDSIMQPFIGNDARMSSEADVGRLVTKRRGDDSLQETRSAMPFSASAAASPNDSRFLPPFDYNQTSPMNTGVLPTVGHSSSTAVCSKISSDRSAIGSKSASPEIAANSCTAMVENDSRKHQRHDGRKVSTPVQGYRWPNEYGTCIIAPPNKTVHDVCETPCAQLDPVRDWTLCWNDQKLSSLYDSKASGASASGACGNGDKWTPFGLLPSKGLSSASSSSSYCPNSTMSSSSTAESSLRRRASGSGVNGAKRSSSVSSSCPSSSSTADLLPSSSKNGDKASLKTDSEKDRRRHTAASENRPLVAASQRFWNLLRSPMEPLNGSHPGRKYIPLNSDASSQSDSSTVANTVSNKNCGPEG